MDSYYSSVVVLLVTTANLIQAGEVRCFCNLPICVTSGYMCKSARGGCFSDLFDFLDVYKARHGCVELLDRERQGQCQNEPGSNAGRSHPRSLLLCCRSDMCNHVDSPEIKTRVNDTFLGSILNSTDTRVLSSVDHSSNEVWFKAATIAVPICGALILFVLIATAVRILRKDGDELPVKGHTHPAGGGGASRRQLYPDSSSKKVPLLSQQQHARHFQNNVSVPPHKQNNVNLAPTDCAKYYDKRGLGFGCGNEGSPCRV